jgi:hypothetical protein
MNNEQNNKYRTEEERSFCERMDNKEITSIEDFFASFAAMMNSLGAEPKHHIVNNYEQEEK